MKHIKEILDEAIANLEAMENRKFTEIVRDLVTAELAAMEDLAPYHVQDNEPQPLRNSI